MQCSNCEPFDTEIAIGLPGQLLRIIASVREAVAAGVLSYNSFESSRELIDQTSFLDLDLGKALPDVLRYHFDCPSCGKCYGLFVETYHGSGGTWSCTGQLPPNNSFKPTPLRGVGKAS